MLRFTRCYLEYTRSLAVKWPSRARRRGYGRYVLLTILILVLLVLFAALIGLGFDDLMYREEPVRIVAHRTGGVMAPENSLEGLELAIGHNCFAAETDTQRTKDGYYIINHDDDYKRLTGVAKKPGDLTLEETMALTITDPATGATAPVPTLDEMLDLVKGRITLFLELKGVSADRQMVDDVVKLIREKDCVENVTLISLKYDIIDYAETQYPEFETAIFIAYAANASTVSWSFVDHYGNVKTPAEFVSACGSTYSGENSTTFNVYNVNASMNGWGAFATFYGNNQSARTTTAYIYVSGGVQSTPRPQTYTNYNNNYGLTKEEQLALGLLVLAAAEEGYYGYNDWGYDDWDYSYYVEPDYSDYWGGGYDDWDYGWDDYGWGW